MSSKPTTEYALFNILPEGKTIEDVPNHLQWLYLYPFRSDYSKAKMEFVMSLTNKERTRLIPKMDWRGEVKTLCELRERTITYSDWRKVK